MAADPSTTTTRATGAPAASSARERFAPGTLLAGRYRIAGPLGRGGMGEVYRASDLKLQQDVALKFLPDSLASDPRWLARLHREVRVARDITHPNVCRVHDIVEWDGLHFISMEYVDGEDLASLLRRIGRLPEDKGLQLAHQLCGGLQAAHERGVVHRDLKPANLMLDGRGRLRITDFGLARVAEQVGGADVASGTPAYMAPEQALGREVSPRSDVYALGLVLYQMFTGRPAFPETTRAELLRAHAERPPLPPTRVQAELDPALERLILRCLEKDPRSRPASAGAVAAALPGGSPLAVALAAGVTPSPEMVAAAGDVGALPAKLALRWLGAALAFAALSYALVLMLRPYVIQRVPSELSPEALELRARDSLRRLGIAPSPYSARNLEYNAEILRHVVRNERRSDRWNNLETGQPAAVYFWYRESPEPLYATTRLSEVFETNPPPLTPGMVNANFDMSGRLIFLRRLSRREVMPFMPKTEPDWAGLFREAGLDPKRFRKTEPLFAPPVFADSRGSWIGVYASRPEIRIRVDAAALFGKPVYFEILGPWSLPQPGSPGFAGFNVLLVVLLLGGLVLARRNLRKGRGDRRSAFRLALLDFTLVMLLWLFQAGHVPDPLLEWNLLTRAVAWALFWSGCLWLFYIALEPFVRRFWPEAIVSWSRLLAGRVRDPLVGRDVLIGLATGYACLVLGLLVLLAPPTLGSDLVRLTVAADLDALSGSRMLLGSLAQAARLGLESAFLYLTLLLLLRLVLRRAAFVAPAFVLANVMVSLGIFDQWLGGTYPFDAFFLAATAFIMYVLLTRVGLVGMLAALVPISLGLFFPAMGSDWNAWYAPSLLVPITAQAALLTFAFHTSLGGRPLLPDETLR